MSKEKAILELYSNARIIHQYADGSIAVYDENEQPISGIDLSAVNSKAAEIEASDKLSSLRDERNKLLSETDYWDASDTPAMSQAQIDYRQALRDITDTYSSLDDVVWPTKPA